MYLSIYFSFSLEKSALQIKKEFDEYEKNKLVKEKYAID